VTAARLSYVSYGIEKASGQIRNLDYGLLMHDHYSHDLLSA